MKNINDLRESLFDTLEKVKSGEIDTDQARAVVGVGQTLVELAKVEVDYVKHFGSKSEFIEIDNIPDGVTSITRHRLTG